MSQQPQFAGEALAKLLAEYDFDTVLDVGCGAGEQTAIFAAHGKKVTPLDYGESLYFRRAVSSLTPLLGDFNTMALPEPHGCVWCSHTLEHQPNVHHFLKRLVACCMEGGVLAITVPPLKHEIVGGHLSLWNAGLLMYQLVLAGLDCSQIRIKQYDYNISALLTKKTIELPALSFDCGDLRALKQFFPPSLVWRSNTYDDPFDGNIHELNWT